MKPQVKIGSEMIGDLIFHMKQENQNYYVYKLANSIIDNKNDFGIEAYIKKTELYQSIMRELFELSQIYIKIKNEAIFESEDKDRNYYNMMVLKGIIKKDVYRYDRNKLFDTLNNLKIEHIRKNYLIDDLKNLRLLIGGVKCEINENNGV